ncbi:MAG TPA: malate dehydrogenase [bacterium]
MARAKAAVVGAGNVGATAAHLLALKDLADVTLIDIVEGLAAGKALDLAQSSAVEGFRARVEGTTDFAAMAESRLIVITAGMARKPGMSRDDLLAANAGIVGPIAERIPQLARDAVVMVVTNPLDVMVALALERTGFPRQRVFGMAGVLDTARLRTFVGMHLGVPPSEVDAMVLGSHGDLMVPVRGSITVRGEPVRGRVEESVIDGWLARTRDGGAEIVKLLKQGSAYYAPASGIVAMAEAVLTGRKTVLPACVRLEGEFGLKQVCIGVPVRIGAGGAETVVEIELTGEERSQLHAAAAQVAEMARALHAKPGQAK